jgi:hydroxypyruvate isomerase
LTLPFSEKQRVLWLLFLPVLYPIMLRNQRKGPDTKVPNQMVGPVVASGIMATFSANLGFLWNDRPLPDAIRAAADSGFDAVECHWPYDTPASETAAALSETGLTMLGLNTRRGADDEFGLAALAGRAREARLSIDEAIRYACAISASAVHVMAGLAPPKPDAFLTFLGNLRYACEQAAPHDITILIEPLNTLDTPGYYLHNTIDAAGIIDAVDRPNLKLMFDCYHTAKSGADVLELLPQVLPILGHVQFASVPDRTEPDHGDLDYASVFEMLDGLGWDRPLGAEYRPTGTVEQGLSWMQTLR